MAEGGGAPVLVERVHGTAIIEVGDAITTDTEIDLGVGAAVQLRQGTVVAVLYAPGSEPSSGHYVGDAMRNASRVASWSLATHLGGWDEPDWRQTLATAPRVAAAHAVGDGAGALVVSADLPAGEGATLLRARLLLEAGAFDALLQLLEVRPPQDRQASLLLRSFALRGRGDRDGADRALREAASLATDSTWGRRATLALQGSLY